MSATSPEALEGRRHLTIEEWAALPEDEPGELVDGVLLEEEMPDLAHEAVVLWLILTLDAWLRPRGGRVFGSDVRLLLPRDRGRKGDVVAWMPGHPPLPRHGAVAVPPDLVIEVISPAPSDNRRDRIDKAAEYAEFGVRWYWLVDPTARAFEIFELVSGGHYLRVVGASRGRIEQAPGCEGLALDLDALWAEIDSLEDDAGR